MKMKIVVSFSIFTLLLSFAWFLNQQQNHSEYNKLDSQLKSLNVVPLNNVKTPLNTNVSTDNSNDEWKLYLPFRPREYVRIIGY